MPAPMSARMRVPVVDVGGVDRDRPQPGSLGGGELVAHEGEQRRHDQRRAAAQGADRGGRGPVHRRLPPPGRLHHQHACLVGDQCVDGPGLVRMRACGIARHRRQHRDEVFVGDLHEVGALALVPTQGVTPRAPVSAPWHHHATAVRHRHTLDPCPPAPDRSPSCSPPVGCSPRSATIPVVVFWTRRRVRDRGPLPAPRASRSTRAPSRPVSSRATGTTPASISCRAARSTCGPTTRAASTSTCDGDDVFVEPRVARGSRSAHLQTAATTASKTTSRS